MDSLPNLYVVDMSTLQLQHVQVHADYNIYTIHMTSQLASDRLYTKYMTSILLHGVYMINKLQDTFQTYTKKHNTIQRHLRKTKKSAASGGTRTHNTLL